MISAWPLGPLGVSRILFDANEIKKAKSPSRYSIEILKDGVSSPLILDFGEIVKEAPKEYAVTMRGSRYPIAVSDAFYKKFFEETNRLDAPKEEKKPEPISSKPESPKK